MNTQKCATQSLCSGNKTVASPSNFRASTLFFDSLKDTVRLLVRQENIKVAFELTLQPIHL